MNTKAIILSLAFCVSVVHCAPNDEVAAEVFVKDSSNRLYDIFNEVANVEFNKMRFEKTKETFSEDSSELAIASLLSLLFDKRKNKIRVKLLDELRNFSVEAAKFKYNEFKNPELKAALQHIHFGTVVAELDSEDSVEDAISAIETNKNICSFKEKTKCDLSFTEDVVERISESNDPEELKYYWNEWRSKNQENFKEILKKNVLLLRKAGELFEITPSMYWFKRYYDEHFIDEMEKVVTEMQPLYQQLHAFVRSLLVKEYGAAAETKNGVIHHHLFEKILDNAWDKKGMFSNLITKENLVDMTKILEEKNVTARNIVDFASDFFKKMGLDELPKEFWETQVLALSEDDDCGSMWFDGSSKPYLMYCPNVYMKKLLQMHGWMAYIYYANEKKNLPYAYFESYDFKYPVGEAAILSAMSSKHMDSLGLIKDTKYAEDDMEMARLLHLSVHTVLKLPMYYVHVRVMNDFASNTVKFKNVNKHYWILMQKYAGVVPSVTLKDNDITLPYNFYDEIENNLQTTKFISEIMGYQIYESLCKKSGHTTDLHKCDFSDSTEAGTTLKEMMSMGSKKPWRELLSVITGETTGMSAKPLMNYFSPLQKWIMEQNTQSGATVGWN